MPCKDCFNNCDPIIYDKCVLYTGEDIPLLDICNGDSLYEFQQAIVNKLLSALDGTGIVLEDVTLDNCPALQAAFIGKDPTLVNLLQLLIDSQCTLAGIVAQLAPTPYAFNTACLTGLPSNPNRDDILQASLNLLCSISLTVNALPTTYVKITDLNSLVQQILQGNSSTANYNTRLVPNVAVAYFGSLSNFDNTGKGVTANGFDKVNICNGSNGTPDLRGRAIVGAVRNVPGGTLDTAVSPTNPLNIGPVDYSVGDKFGENFHKLTSAEMPAHSHPVTDPGHRHALPPGIQQDGTQSGGEGGTDEKAPVVSLQTAIAQTGITVGASGGDIAHNVRQPSIAGVWIMYIP